MQEIREFATEKSGGVKDEEENDDDVKDAAKVFPTHTAVLEALKTLRDYFQFNFENKTSSSRLHELEKTFFEKSRIKNKPNILNYFVKN